jgi:hypothetical protein
MDRWWLGQGMENFMFVGTDGPERAETWIGPISGPVSGDLSAHLQCQPYEHPLPTPSPSPQGPSGPSAHIRVAVLNATDQAGLAGVTGDGLARTGYVVTTVGDALGDHTAVYFTNAASRADAKALTASFFHNAPVEPLPGSLDRYASVADVVVVLGPDYRP